MNGFAETYLDEAVAALNGLDSAVVERIAEGLAELRGNGGRLFVLGVGGSAAHASHAVSDFRRLCELEAYTPTDNVSELTARVNDDGWEDTFVEWLRGSRLCQGDAVLVFSVGGGDPNLGISANLVRALELAREVGAPIYGVVGRDGGYTARLATACVIVPTINEARVTPHTEGICAIVLHLLVSHPLLSRHPGKWESLH